MSETEIERAASEWASNEGFSLLAENGEVSGGDEEGYIMNFSGDPRDILRAAYLRIVGSAPPLWEYGTAMALSGYLAVRSESDDQVATYPNPDGLGSGRVRRRAAVDPGPWMSAGES